MSGIIPNTLDSELNPPGRETTIVGNLVVDNNNYEAPANRFGLVAQGMGIVMPGRVGDIVEKNIVVNHDKYGLVASPMLDVNLYFSQHLQVNNNIKSGSDENKTIFGDIVSQTISIGGKKLVQQNPYRVIHLVQLLYMKLFIQ